MPTTNGTTDDYGPNGIKDSRVIGKSALGTGFHATLIRLGRYAAVFEIYAPIVAIRASEVLDDLKIVIKARTVYSGRAVVCSLLEAGSKVVCEVALGEASWNDDDLFPELLRTDKLAESFKSFQAEWQKLYRVTPGFKVIMADMHTYFSELKLWLELAEMKIGRSASKAGTSVASEMVDELAGPVIRSIDTFIEQFEMIAGSLETGLHSVHREYLRRQLHPLLLVSPFAHRAFRKPLGYAGDYEIVDMMLRPPHEGETLFAKIINVWLLGQAPAQAHRNRVTYLSKKLVEEAIRKKAKGSRLRVFNLGCGPAQEVQEFLQEHDFAGQLTLVDFNEETLNHLKGKLDKIRKRHAGGASVQIVKKSVQQILKESLKPVVHPPRDQFDFVYCAGLFDYLSQQVCKRLMNILYDMVAPGGLLLATNVSDVMNPSRPFRYSMEYILDWHLIYRDRNELADLAPDQALRDCVNVITEGLGVNLFIEVRKPGHD